MTGIPLLTRAGGHCAFHRLDVNTDSTGLLPAERSFKKDHHLLNRTFSVDAKAVPVLITGTTPELARVAVKAFGERFSREIGRVGSVCVSNQEPFFERQAFLYLDQDPPEKSCMDILQARPLLTRLTRNHTLDELSSLSNQALQHRALRSALELAPCRMSCPEGFAQSRVVGITSLPGRT